MPVPGQGPEPVREGITDLNLDLEYTTCAKLDTSFNDEVRLIPGQDNCYGRLRSPWQKNSWVWSAWGGKGSLNQLQQV
jgi:hypothetical protein